MWTAAGGSIELILTAAKEDAGYQCGTVSTSSARTWCAQLKAGADFVIKQVARRVLAHLLREDGVDSSAADRLVSHALSGYEPTQLPSATSFSASVANKVMPLRTAFVLRSASDLPSLEAPRRTRCRAPPLN
jgi:hypothetical protein